jgi:hypothetical protein
MEGDSMNIVLRIEKKVAFPSTKHWRFILPAQGASPATSLVMGE